MMMQLPNRFMYKIVFHDTNIDKSIYSDALKRYFFRKKSILNIIQLFLLTL